MGLIGTVEQDLDRAHPPRFPPDIVCSYDLRKLPQLAGAVDLAGGIGAVAKQQQLGPVGDVRLKVAGGEARLRRRGADQPWNGPM